MQRRFALDRRCPLAVVTPHVVVASPHYAHHVVVAPRRRPFAPMATITGQMATVSRTKEGGRQ